MKYAPIFWGGLGGILPNVVQKAQELLKSAPDTAVDSIIYPTFLIGVALVACIGGIIVAAFREQDSRKALFLGISAPALIMVVASAPAQNNSTPTADVPPAAAPMMRQQSFLPSLFSNAYADESAPAAPQSTRTIEVLAHDSTDTFQTEFLGTNDSVIQTETLSLPTLAAKLTVPATATSVRFAKEGQTSEKYALPTNTTSSREFLVGVKQGRAYGFWAALGGSPEVTYQFDVTQDEAKPAPQGTEAWARAGDFDGSQWSGAFFDFPMNKLPTKGEQFAVIYPVNLRADANVGSKRVGELRLEQRVEVLDIQAKDNQSYWVRIKVLH